MSYFLVGIIFSPRDLAFGDGELLSFWLRLVG